MPTARSMARACALSIPSVTSWLRGFMFSVGCMQAQRCNTNACPVGVTTQNPKLQRGLVVADKSERVYAYHKNTVHAVAEFVAAMGLDHPSQLAPHHVFRRMSPTQVASLDEIYLFLRSGQLLDGTAPERMHRYWNESTSAQFKFDPSLFDSEPHLYVRQFTDIRSAQ